MGSVVASNRLTNEKGTVARIADDPEWQLPQYFSEDRKAGAAGDMVLSVSINTNGKPTKIRVVHSLSPHLDEATIKTVHTWRFKLNDGSPGSLPDTFPLHIRFEPEYPMDL